MSKTILALDVGNHTGWATCDGARVTSGIQDFTPKRGDLAGVRWTNFNAWLWDMLIGCAPDLVVYERWTRGPGDAPKIRAGFITRIEEHCDMRGTVRLEVSPAELKLWLTGKGNASKEEMIAAVLARKWTEKLEITDDESDALALLHYAMEKMG